MMKNIVKTILPVATIVAAGLAAQPASAGTAPKVTADLIKLGETAYKRECAMCHSETGNGKGAGAYILDPKPRNFELGVYKLRSTPNGEPPTAGDLFKTITNGVPNSMMPAFAALSEKERWGLAHVLLRFGGLEEEKPKSVKVSAEPKTTADGVANGKKIYVKLKCDTCHGADGWGEGPSSLTLKNDAKERIYPANLTSGVFKGGSSAKDLYIRIATGMDGSPMPSYSAEAKPNEIWDLVHYVQTLAK